ncbi:MAG: LysM peptidoglycan-binding domain-containing protein [Flavobacteriia bacterium]|nr:LysM peptidoglycan-binding domain-containing protein [Flavobacteriia bacterium]
MRFLPWFLFFSLYLGAQMLPEGLKIDSNFAIIQGYDNASLSKLYTLFQEVDSNKLVILHYGGSHIQAEHPTTVVRKLLQDKFGDAGRGLMFNYAAANSYSSINYSSTFKGKWSYNKSYQGRKDNLPLGICGMVVETEDSTASLAFQFKATLPEKATQLTLFFENDSLSFPVEVVLNGKVLHSNVATAPTGIRFSVTDSIKNLELKFHSAPGKKRFRFYGINLEHQQMGGVVYHSTGVGAAAFHSILILDKLPEQIPLINPDMVILDFGTNDILYHNRIESTLTSEIEKAIGWWRKMCPEILIVLTSTQDLYYKKHPITAGIDFRNLMDSIAREHACLFWNWYDLAGGLNTIRDWAALGFAKSDHVHLTKEGYKVKGSMLFLSFMNTLARISQNRRLNELTMPLKVYDNLNTPSSVVISTQNPPKPRIHHVKAGDTLSSIARKYHTTVGQLKKTNHLKSDIIRIGQKLRLP